MVPTAATEQVFDKDYSKYGFHDKEESVFKTEKGLTEETVRQISKIKNEPEWMLKLRLKSLEEFWKRPMPQWGANLNTIDFNEIYYYLKPTNRQGDTWDDVPEYIKNTFDKLGIPEAERKFLGGVGAQYECLTGDTKVFTNPAGPKEIKSIKAGDKVFAYDENNGEIKCSVVKGLMYKGKREVFEAKIGTKKIKTTLNHPFLALTHNKKDGARRGRYEKEWRYLSDLKVGDLVAIAKQLPHEGTPYKFDSAKNTSFRKHVNDFIGFAKIESIEPAGIEPVYDIEVENYHNFVAEGILVHNSEVVYHKIRDDLAKLGVVFLDMDGGLREYPELVKKYFNTIIPYNDNKFAALNTAVWSGGSFVYVPAGVKVDLPLQAYFRINAKNMGQFERTLIIAEPGASVHYIEGCFTKGAPIKTIGGIKKIEEIREGDMVLTHRGNHKRVYKTQKRIHNGLMCTIKYKDEKIKITGGHPVLSFKRMENKIQPEWIEAGKLNKNDYIGIYVDDSDLNDFDKIIGYSVGEKIFDNSNLLLAQEQISVSDGIENFAFVPVKEIKKEIVSDLEVYNFSVEEDESYVAHGIVVHNCTAPTYSSDSLHSAVVELIALEGSRIQYTTIQNWSNNVYNLVTKRAFAHKDATVFWVDGNMGSKRTMKYPSIYLLGEGARAEILSVAFAGKGQHQDAGGKILHFAPNTSSRITSKSVSKDGGRTTYRGLLKVAEGCHNVKSHVTCDALILDDKSASDTVPYMEINEKDVNIEHEATVGKIGEEQLFYLMSRGLSDDQAKTMIVSGFMEPFTKELPLEYAIELNRLIALNMEGSVG